MTKLTKRKWNQIDQIKVMTKTEHWYDFIDEFFIRYYPSFPGVTMCSLAFSIASDILNEKTKHKHNSKNK